MGDGKLIGVSIQEMFEQKSVYSTPILSSEEALGILQKEDEEIISDKTGEIEEIKLEYVMIPDWTTEISKPIELRPYWCIIKNVEEDGEQYTTADRINAITGGDLSYGEQENNYFIKMSDYRIICEFLYTGRQFGYFYGSYKKQK